MNQYIHDIVAMTVVWIRKILENMFQPPEILLYCWRDLHIPQSLCLDILVLSSIGHLSFQGSRYLKGDDCILDSCQNKVKNQCWYLAMSKTYILYIWPIDRLVALMSRVNHMWNDFYDMIMLKVLSQTYR